MVRRYLSRLQDKADALHCMLLPVGSYKLLLPSVAIAEIDAGLPADTTSRSYHWRGIAIPFFPLEQLFDDTSSIKLQETAILHRMYAAEHQPFWGFGLTGLPNIIRIEHGDINLDSTRSWQYGISVLVRETPAFIPDLKSIELKIAPSSLNIG